MSQDLYARAVETWGERAQTDIAIEELAEAIVAIQHWRRKRCNATFVAQEIADVLIVAEQMRLIVGAESVDAAKAEKLDRLKRRLDDHDAKTTRVVVMRCEP